MSTIKWAVDADGDWSTLTDWSGGALPGATSAVVLDSAHAHTVTHSTGTDTIDSLLTSTDTLSLTGGTLAVQSGAVFNQALSVSGGSLLLSGKTNTAATAVKFTGGDVQLAKGATLTTKAAFALGQTSGIVSAGPTVEGAGTLVTKGATAISGVNYDLGLTLGGGITWANTGTVTDQTQIGIGSTLGATATISNAKGAVFDLVSDRAGIENLSVTAGGVYAVGSAIFTNAGLLERTGDNYSSTFEAFLNNTGTLSVNSGGSLILYGGGSLGGTLAGGGVVDLFGGTYALKAAKILNGTEVALFGGTATIAAGLTIGYLAVDGGAVDGAGTLANNGTLVVYQTFLIGGGLTWRNNGVIVLNSTALGSDTTATGLTDTLLNTAHATVELAGNAAIEAYDGPAVAVTNSGLLETIASTTSLATNAEIGGKLISTGTIKVGSGTLRLYGGGTLAGKITGGGTLVLATGAFSLAGAAIAAGTDVVLAGGTIAIAAGKTLSNLIFTSGEIDGPGTLATTGPVTYDGVSSFFDEPVLTLGGGLTWSNSGAATVLASIAVGDAAGLTASFVNNSAGTFDFAANVELDEGNGNVFDPGYQDNSTFSNAGLLEKTAGTGATTIGSALDSTGTIKVTSGTLSLTNGGTIAGTLAGGGTVLLGGGLFELLSPKILDGTQLVLAGGTLAIGAGQTLSSLVFTGGKIDGPGTLATSGTVTINAPTYSYEIALTLGGGVTWNSSGDVTVLGTIGIGDSAGLTASFVNTASGTFDVSASLIDDYVNTSNTGGSDGSATFANAGLLETSGSADVITFAAALTNTGTIDVTSGTLDLTDGGTLGGAITGGGTVLLAGGSFTLNTPTLADGTALILDGGTVAIAAGTTLSDLGLLYGEIDGPGTFAPTGVLVSAVGNAYDDDSLVQLGGGVVWHNTGTVSVGLLDLGDSVAGGASLVNSSGGVFNLDTLENSSSTASITNAGQVIFDGSGSSYFGGTFINTGTLALGQSSQLNLSGVATISGLLTGAGGLVLDRGRFALSGLTEAAQTSIQTEGGTIALAAGAAASLVGAFDAFKGIVQLGAASVLTESGTSWFGSFDDGTFAEINGAGHAAGTLATTGSVVVDDTNASDTTTMILGGKAIWNNSGFVYDSGFIRVGDAAGLTASFVNSGTFDITTDNGGIGNNAVLSPLGLLNAGSSTFANSGLLEKAGGYGGTSYIASAVTNTGTIEAGSGDLAFTSAIAGTGALQIDAGATLETNGFAQTQSLTFNGAGGTLLLDSLQSVTTAISGLAVGDSFDLSSEAGATASITGSTLSITPEGLSALTFLSASSLAGDSVTTGNDGNGGTLITLTAAAAAHPAATTEAASGTAAQLTGTTIAGFGPGAPIDFTDLAFTSLHALGFAGHVLTVSDGAHTAHLTLPGITSLTDLATAADLHGGTLLTDKG